MVVLKSSEAQLGGGRPGARPPLAPERGGAPPPCRMKRKKEWRKSVSQE